MPLLIEIDFDALRKFNYNLYHRVSAALKHTHGAHAVDVTRLGQEDTERLIEFVREVERQRAVQEAQRQRKVEADKQAGERRLLQYVSEQRLENTVGNSKAISKWLDENTH